MADPFGSRYRGFTGEQGAKGQFFGAAADVLFGLSDMAIDSQIATETAQAQAAQIDEFNELQLWMNQNRDKPDKWLEHFSTSVDAMKKNILKDVRSPVSKEAIENKMIVDFAQLESRVKNAAESQSRDNQEVALDLGLEKLKETPSIGIWTKEEVNERLDNALIMIDEAKNADDRRLQVEGQDEEMLDTLAKSLISQEILQNADSVDYISRANEIAKFDYDLDSLFSDEEIAELKNTYASTQAANARTAATELKEAQDTTGRQMLVDLWNGELSDSQDITNALDSNLITTTMATSLRNALLKPKEGTPTEMLMAEVEVKNAIDNYHKGDLTKQGALNVLYDHANTLGPTKGSTLLNKLYAEEVDPELATMKREGKSFMEEYIRTRDRFSGMFSDDKQEIMLAAEAQLLLDGEIERAAEAKKPLGRRDIMIKALEIGQQQRNKLDRMEKGEVPTVPYQLGMQRTVRPYAGLDIKKLEKLDKELTVERTEVPSIITDAEYDSLPSGAEFIDKETGKRYRKP
jgi:hypothetical protein